MNPLYSEPALICPYTLMEDEALAWSILLFNRTLLLHPFPLPLPTPFSSLIDQEWLEVRSPRRSPEEIRQKEKNLRDIKAFISGKPDQGFLTVLKEISLLEDRETQEELVGLLKGQPYKNIPEQTDVINGPILLCLIHEWIMDERTVDAALIEVENQEKNLTQGWHEELEDEDGWNKGAPGNLKKNEEEIPCPLALKAWRELKNQIVPEPLSLFTSQSWVWKDHYGIDWEESPTLSISLPNLGGPAGDPFQLLKNKIIDLEKISALRQAWNGMLKAFFSHEISELHKDWERLLSALNLPDRGRYKLILPLSKPSTEKLSPAGGTRERGKIEPLILITAK